MPEKFDQISGPQKAAIVIASLDDSVATEVLKQMLPDEIQLVTREISRLGYVPANIVNDTLKEFLKLMKGDSLMGNENRANALLSRALTPLERSSLIESSAEDNNKALEILQSADPVAILDAIKDDQPQATAITLRNISPVKASIILRALSPEVREEVIERMTKLDNVPADVVHGIAQSLRSKLKLATSKEEIRRSSGIGIASTIVSYIGGVDARNILKAIEEKDAETANRMKDLIFTFDDITDMENRALQQIIRELDRHILAVSLKGANERIRNKILSNVSERAKEELMEEFETLGAVRLTDVEDAQRKVVETIRRLDEEGKVTIIKKT